MGNTLKFKLGISVFSIIGVILVLLIENNFYVPVTIIKWRELTWDDFQGIPLPFTFGDASIASNIYITYDSTINRYISYAGHNNQRSWVKGHTHSTEQINLLKHEQYHFNLTEVYSRKLNDFIENTPDLSEGDITKRLLSLRAELKQEQSDYDEESNHSLNYDIQRLWEFKIDSLLTEYDSEDGVFTDYYSGASVFFPRQPILSNERNESGIPYRAYELSSYDMSFFVISFHGEVWDSTNLMNEMISFHTKDSTIILNTGQGTSETYPNTHIIYGDKKEQTITYRKWVVGGHHSYIINATIFQEDTIKQGYHQIAMSFLNSFKVKKTRSYWLDRNKSQERTYQITSLIKNTGTVRGTECFTLAQEPDKPGFYGEPVEFKSGGIIIPHDISLHADSLVKENLVFTGNDVLRHPIDSTDQLLYIPQESIQERPTDIKIGYYLKEDTVNECRKYYYHQIRLE